jgi:hypothetical protein
MGHFPFAWNPAPDFESRPAADIEQWCLPSRRQQAGRLASGSEAKAGINSERLKRASNTMAVERRKQSY